MIQKIITMRTKMILGVYPLGIKVVLEQRYENLPYYLDSESPLLTFPGVFLKLNLVVTDITKTVYMLQTLTKH